MKLISLLLLVLPLCVECSSTSQPEAINDDGHAQRLARRKRADHHSINNPTWIENETATEEDDVMFPLENPCILVRQIVAVSDSKHYKDVVCLLTGRDTVPFGSTQFSFQDDSIRPFLLHHVSKTFYVPEMKINTKTWQIVLPNNAVGDISDHAVFGTVSDDAGDSNAADTTTNKRRRLQLPTGNKIALVARVVDRDGIGHPDTVAALETRMWDAALTFGEQYNRLSYGQLTFTPFVNAQVPNGVTQIAITGSASGLTIAQFQAQAQAAMAANFGNDWRDLADHFLFVSPPGGATDWFGLADLPGKLSFYNSNNAGAHTELQTVVHEVGHNYGLDHSGDFVGQIWSGDFLDIDDISGVMGGGGFDRLPNVGFNGAKSFQLGWYEDKVETVGLSPLATCWEGKVHGVVDFDNNAVDNVILHVPNGEDVTGRNVSDPNDFPQEYFVAYNRAKGFNSNTEEGADTLMITSRNTLDESRGDLEVNMISWLRFNGTEGEYSVENFGPSGDKLTFRIDEVQDSVEPFFVGVSILLNDAGCSSESPSSSPSISPNPSGVPSSKPTLSSMPSTKPSGAPSQSAMPSMSPSSGPTMSSEPSSGPSSQPSVSSEPTTGSESPSNTPSLSNQPSLSANPSAIASSSPTKSGAPSVAPSAMPSLSLNPSSTPSEEVTVSVAPSQKPSSTPTLSAAPSMSPSSGPTMSSEPSSGPSSQPSVSSKPTTGSESPSNTPSLSNQPSLSANPSATASSSPTKSGAPSVAPSAMPSLSLNPSSTPSEEVTVSVAPSQKPSSTPTLSAAPSAAPSSSPSESSRPSSDPTFQPTISSKPSPISEKPSASPSVSSKPSLSAKPSSSPSAAPSLSAKPSNTPSSKPSQSVQPSAAPTGIPSESPSLSRAPSGSPSIAPTMSHQPSAKPSAIPSVSFQPSLSNMPSLSNGPTMAPVITDESNPIPGVPPVVEVPKGIPSSSTKGPKSGKSASSGSGENSSSVQSKGTKSGAAAPGTTVATTANTMVDNNALNDVVINNAFNNVATSPTVENDSDGSKSAKSIKSSKSSKRDRKLRMKK